MRFPSDHESGARFALERLTAILSLKEKYRNCFTLKSHTLGKYREQHSRTTTFLSPHALNGVYNHNQPHLSGFTKDALML